MLYVYEIDSYAVLSHVSVLAVPLSETGQAFLNVKFCMVVVLLILVVPQEVVGTVLPLGGLNHGNLISANGTYEHQIVSSKRMTGIEKWPTGLISYRILRNHMQLVIQSKAMPTTHQHALSH
ncbi:hypothetical protein V6N13_032547 [Hibiscus sabdariffa]